jgi:ADP-ribose pyrophosphatase YjhB (NUDIX family)
MEWFPHITVATVIERDGKFLLVHELDTFQKKMVYNQPAGHWEKDESLIEAAIRETQEETAWSVNIESWIGLYTYTAPSNGVTYLRIAFVGYPLAKQQTALDEGIQEAVWMDYDTLLQKEAAGELRSPLVKQVIDDYRNGRRLPLNSIYEHGT